MSTLRPSIGVRLGAGYAIMVALIVAMTLSYIANVQGLNDKLSQINDVNALKQRYAINFRGSVHDRSIAIRDVAMLEQPARDAAILEIATLAEDYTRITPAARSP